MPSHWPKAYSYCNLKSSTTYRLVNSLLVDIWPVWSLADNIWFARAMSSYVPCDGVLLFSLKQCVISLAFCDIWKNQGLGKRYEP